MHIHVLMIIYFKETRFRLLKKFYNVYETSQITMPIIMIIGFFKYYTSHLLQRNGTFFEYNMNKRD